MVTDSSPINKSESRENSQYLHLRYGEQFETLCGYYMSIGMSYYDYWDGDSCMTKYYRKMDQYNKERKNYELWLQGAYFYEAILDASPILNSFSKKNKPFPYRSAPISVTRDKDKYQTEQEKHKRIENGKQAMEIMMVNFNKRFETKDKESKMVERSK